MSIEKKRAAIWRAMSASERREARALLGPDWLRMWREGRVFVATNDARASHGISR